MLADPKLRDTLSPREQISNLREKWPGHIHSCLTLCEWLGLGSRVSCAHSHRGRRSQIRLSWNGFSKAKREEGREDGHTELCPLPQ